MQHCKLHLQPPQQKKTSTTMWITTINDSHIFTDVIFRFLSIEDYHRLLTTCKYFHELLTQQCDNFLFVRMLITKDFYHILPHYSFMASTEAKLLYHHCVQTKRLNRYSCHWEYTMPIHKLLHIDESTLREIMKYIPFRASKLKGEDWFHEEKVLLYNLDEKLRKINTIDELTTLLDNYSLIYPYLSTARTHKHKCILPLISSKVGKGSFSNLSRELCLILLENNGSLIHYSNELQDKESVLIAICSSSFELKFIEYPMIADWDVLSTALRYNKDVLCCLNKKQLFNVIINEPWKDELMLRAIRKNGSFIHYIPPHLHTKELILLAMNYCYSAEGRSAIINSPVVASDREIALKLVHQYEFDIPQQYNNDREIVLAAVHRNYGQLQYASKMLQKDREIVSTAIKRDATQLNHVHPSLLDRELVLYAVSRADVFEFIPVNLRVDREIALNYIRVFPAKYLLLADHLQNDPEFLEIVLKTKEPLKILPERIRHRKQFILDYCKNIKYSMFDLNEELQHDIDIIVALAEQNFQIVNSIPPKLKRDKTLFLKLAKIPGNTVLEYYPLSNDDKADLDLLLLTMKYGENYNLLAYIPEVYFDDLSVRKQLTLMLGTCYYMRDPLHSIMKDELFARLVLLYKSNALKYAPDKYRSCKDTVIWCAGKDYSTLKYASLDLRRDKEFLLQICQRYDHGSILKYVDKDLCDNADFVYDIVVKRPEDISYVSTRLKADVAFVHSVIEAQPACIAHSSDRAFKLSIVAKYGKCFEYLSCIDQNDREYVLAAVGTYRQAFSYKYSEDKEVVLAAVTSCNKMINKASYKLANDVDVMRAARFYKSFIDDSLPEEIVFEALLCGSPDYIGINFSIPRHIVLASIARNKKWNHLIPNNLENDKEVVLAIVSHSDALVYPFSNFLTDRDVIKAAVQCTPRNYEYVPSALKKDRDIVLIAVKSGISEYQIPLEYMNDREIALAAKSYSFASEELKNDKSFCLKIGVIPKHFSDDKEFVMEAIRGNPYLYSNACPSLQKDKDITLTAIKGNARIWKFLCEEMKSDIEIAFVAATLAGIDLLTDVPEYSTSSKVNSYRNVQEEIFWMFWNCEYPDITNL
jgi:hypothetical protein